MSQPIIADATSGRSSARRASIWARRRATAEIAMGSKRVSLHAAGAAYHWCKPACLPSTADGGPSTSGSAVQGRGSQIQRVDAAAGQLQEEASVPHRGRAAHNRPELIALVGRSKVVATGSTRCPDGGSESGLIFDDGAGASGASSRGSGSPGSTRTAAAPSAGRRARPQGRPGQRPPKNVRGRETRGVAGGGGERHGGLPRGRERRE